MTLIGVEEAGQCGGIRLITAAASELIGSFLTTRHVENI